jgi:hypothetical protein
LGFTPLSHIFCSLSLLAFFGNEGRLISDFEL